MPSFQSPVPISGRPWLPTSETSVQRTRTMLKQRRASFRHARLEIGFILALGQHVSFQKRYNFVQYGHLAGRFNELDDGIRQPQ